MKRFAIIAAILGSSLLAFPAFAQSAGTPAQAPGSATVGQPALRGQGQKAGSRLARLGFDAQTAEKVRKIHQKYRTERQSIKQTIRTNRQRIAQLLSTNSNDQSAFRSAITGLQNAQKQMQASRDREMAELQQVLTAKQQAQLMTAANKRGKKGRNSGARGPRGPRG